MQLDVRPRSAGKSTSIIDWLAQDPVNRGAVSHDMAAARRLYRQAVDTHQAVSWRMENFISIGTLGQTRGRTYGSIEFWIDNADLCLQRLLSPFQVTGATWTLDPIEPYSSPPFSREPQVSPGLTVEENES